eukprot:6341472-Pyramimonas_sp.AAC.1
MVKKDGYGDDVHSRGPVCVGGGPCQAADGRRRLFPLPAVHVDPTVRVGRSRKQRRRDRAREVRPTLVAEATGALNWMNCHRLSESKDSQKDFGLTSEM